MTRRDKLGLSIAALVAALLLAWWMWPRSEASRRATAPSSATSLAPTVRAPALPPPAADTTPERTEVRLEQATVSQDTDAASGVFAGRVIDWGNGEPVSGAELVFAGAGGGQSVESGADGRFEFRPGALGSYRLQVASADGYLPYAPAWGSSPIELTARAGLRIDGIIVYLSPALDYRGRVLDSAGKPVAGASIRVLAGRDQALLPLEESYRSNPGGEFTFHAPDFAVIEATHPDHEPGSAVLDGDAQITHRLDIVLGTRARSPHPGDPAPADDDAAIIGRVVGSDGKPVPAFTVIALRQRGVMMQVRTFGSFFDAEGRFRLDAPAGDYVVRATAYGHATSAGVSARAEPAPTREVRLELPRGGTVTGVVIDAVDRRPLALAKVSVEGALGDGNATVPVRQTAVTNDQGEFTLGGLPAGVASVIAAAANHDQRIVSGLQVEDGGTLGPITIELGPTPEGEKPKLELAGIGAQLSAAEDGMVIAGLIEGGGALEAGLQVGEMIIAVDGKTVVELGFGDTIQHIRGLEGTSVTLTVRRAGGETADIVVTRRKIRA